TELAPRAMMDVCTIYTLEHSPAARGVYLLVVGEQPAHHPRRVGAELQEILRLKRTRRAHDVAPESDFRGSLGGKDVRVDGIGEIEPSIQVFVRLEIEILVLPANVGVVVRFRKEPSGPQHDARQTARPE